GGLPCPPFAVAGKMLGSADERNLFPEAIRIAKECRPRAVMIENVRGILDPAFADYREWVLQEFGKLGLRGGWTLFQASAFGVPQLRPRAVLVLVTENIAEPDLVFEPSAPPTVGGILGDLMASEGWTGARKWAKQ